MKTFPIKHTLKGKTWIVDNIPLSLLEPHAAQAMKNHGKTLDELAAAGGLSHTEAMAVIEDRDHNPTQDHGEAMHLLCNLAIEHKRAVARAGKTTP